MTKKPDIVRAATQKALLKFVTTVTIPKVTKRMDPRDCFKHRPDLFIWGDFEKYVLPALQPINSAPEALFMVSSLTRDANDSKIRKEFQRNHLAEWHHVAAFIKRQPTNEIGLLLTNGYTKIFYMPGVNGEVFTVYVRCRGGRVRQVGAMRLDEHEESRADHQVFSCNS